MSKPVNIAKNEGINIQSSTYAMVFHVFGTLIMAISRQIPSGIHVSRWAITFWVFKDISIPSRRLVYLCLVLVGMAKWSLCQILRIIKSNTIMTTPIARTVRADIIVPTINCRRKSTITSRINDVNTLRNNCRAFSLTT